MDKKKHFDEFIKYSNIGFQMLATILIGVFGGIEIDKWLNLKFKYFTLFLTIFSVVIAIYHAIKDLIKK